MQILKLSKQQYALNKTYLALGKCLILCFVGFSCRVVVLTDNPMKYIFDFEVKEILAYDELFRDFFLDNFRYQIKKQKIRLESHFYIKVLGNLLQITVLHY